MPSGSLSRRYVFFRGLGASAATQVVSIILGIASVPIGLSYFGPLQYGIWLLIGSVMAYMQLSPFGTTTAAAVMIAKETDGGRRRLIIRATFRWLSGIAILIVAGIVVAILLSSVWIGVFGPIAGHLRDEALAALAICLLSYALRNPTLTYTSAFVGLQEVHLERFYIALLPILVSFGALLATILVSGNLVVLAALTGGGQVLVGFVAAMHFRLSHREISSSDILPGFAPNLIASGSRFFVIGLAGVLVWFSDNIIISAFLGPEHVTAYGVTFKLFTVAFSVFILATSSLMPMFGNAVGQEQWEWVRSTFDAASSSMAILGGLVWVGGLLFAWPIISLWTGPPGYGGLLVVFSLGGYGYLLSTINLNSTFLSSINATRGMLVAGIMEASLNIALSVVLLHFLGVGGVALGTFTAALLTIFWLLPRSIVHATKSRVSMNWGFVGRHFCLAVLPGVIVAGVASIYIPEAWIWPTGAAVCLAYLVISWLALSRPSRALILSALPMSRLVPQAWK